MDDKKYHSTYPDPSAIEAAIKRTKQAIKDRHMYTVAMAIEGKDVKSTVDKKASNPYLA